MTAFDVLERQLHDATRRRRRGRKPLAVLALAAAALLAALVLLDGGTQTNDTPPADEREVAPAPVTYLSPDPDKIVYVRATSLNQDRERTVLEDWHRGDETHRLIRWTDPDGKQWAVDHVITADGVMHQINEEGRYHVIRKTAGDDARTVIGQEQAGFLADFRRRFSQGTLDPAEHTFNERPAVRYHVPRDRKRVGPDQSYYLDRETGAPLGFTSEMSLNPGQRMRVKQVVDEIRVLDPTPENLAKLRELTLRRRSR
jgi:hypothetical protein